MKARVPPSIRALASTPAPIPPPIPSSEVPPLRTQEPLASKDSTAAPDHPEDSEDDLYDTKSKTNHNSNPLGGRGRTLVRSILAPYGLSAVAAQAIART